MWNWLKKTVSNVVNAVKQAVSPPKPASVPQVRYTAPAPSVPQLDLSYRTAAPSAQLRSSQPSPAPAPRPSPTPSPTPSPAPRQTTPPVSQPSGGGNQGGGNQGGGNQGGGQPQPTYTEPSYSAPQPNYQQEPDIVGEMRRQEQERIAKEAAQKAEEEKLLGEFGTASGKQEKLTTAYERLLGEEKVPEAQSQLTTLRGEVTKVKDLLDRLEEDISKRTGGFLVSESQRRRQIAAEEEPLRTQLGRLASGMETSANVVSTGIGNVGTKIQLLSGEQTKELEPLRMRLAAFSDRAAKEMTNFSDSKKNELTALLSKLDSVRQLNQQEWQRVNTLAQEERAYQRQKDLITYQTNEAIREKLATKSAGGSTSDLINKIFDTTPTVGGGTTQTITPSSTKYFDSTFNKLFGLS